MKFCYFILSLGFLGLPVSDITAQYSLEVQEDSTFLLYRFEEVVVYGRRYERSPSLITEIPASEIRDMNGGTVADLLRLDPGLTVTSGPKAETETRIRGFRASDVLVLVDGRPINPGYYGKADLSMLAKDHIAKIKVIKGPGSVAYGSNAMGGIINIVTKNGFDVPQFRVDTEFGPHAFRRVSLNHSQQFGPFNYWISGYEHHSDGFELSHDFEATPLEDGGLRRNSGYHKAGITGKLGFQPSLRSDYSLSAGYHWARKGCAPTASVLELPQYRMFPKWERYGAAFSGRWDMASHMELKSIVFIDGYHDRLKSYLNAEMSDDQLDYDSLLENWTIGGSTEMKTEIGERHRLHLGVHFRRDLMNKKPDVDEAWFSHHHYTGSVFFEDRFRPWDRTVLTFGLGYHGFGTESKAEWSMHWTPMFSLNQELPHRVHFHVSWAKATRFPTMHQLYSESSGNEALKPEEADKIEVGMDRFFMFDFANCQLEAVCFYNTLENLIYRASRSYQYENIAKARLLGYEVRSHWQISSNMRLDLSYAGVYGAQSSKELMEELPEHRWGVRFTWNTQFGSELNYDYNYHGERTTHVSSLNLTGYHVHHIHISQSIIHRIRFHIWVSNLLDENYQEELGYPSPGQRISAGFSWHR